MENTKEQLTEKAVSVKDKIKNAVGSGVSTILAFAIALGVVLLIALPVSALIGEIGRAHV